MINFLRKNRSGLPECLAEADLVVCDMDACLEMFPLRTGPIRDELTSYFSWTHNVNLIFDPLYPAIRRLEVRLGAQAMAEAMQVVGRWEARAMPYAEPRVAMIRLLRQVAASGKLVTIVSEKMQYTATRFVRQFGLSATVDAIVGGDNVKKGRPNPETLLVAMGATGFSPWETVYLAARQSDYAMGKKAGVPTYSYEYALLAGPPLPSHTTLLEEAESATG